MTVITHTRKFKVGKAYPIKDIYDYMSDNEDFDVEDIGKNNIGENAIHLFNHDTETHIWFILSGASMTTFYYRCVYNGQFEL